MLCSAIALLTVVFYQLLAYDPSTALPISSFPLSVLPEATPKINCFQALDYLYGLQPT